MPRSASAAHAARRSPALIVAAAAVLAAAAALLWAAPASAHSALTAVDPVEGSTLEEGTVVTLTFNEELLELGTEVVVTDAAGTATTLTATRPDPTQIAVTMPALAEGAVTLGWRVVSADGHAIEGVLAYVAAAPPVPSVTPSPSPTPSASPSPSDDVASPSASPSPLIAPAPEQDGGSQVPVALWIAIGAAIIAALVTTLAAKSKRAQG